MERFLYNYFGYNKEYIENTSASIIQRTWKKYEDYKKKKYYDSIKYYKIFNNKEQTDKELEQEYYEDMDYWISQRRLMKTKIIGNYVFV